MIYNAQVNDDNSYNGAFRKLSDFKLKKIRKENKFCYCCQRLRLTGYITILL